MLTQTKVELQDFEARKRILSFKQTQTFDIILSLNELKTITIITIYYIACRQKCQGTHLSLELR